MKVRDPHLIQFLYPEIVLKTELSILDRDNFILYCGPSRPQLKKWLSERTKCFISTSGSPDVDLTKPEELVKFVSESKGSKPPQRILDLIKDMDISEVEEMCKVYWVTKKWVGSDTKCESTMFDLFKESTSSMTRALKIYFELREVYPYEVIESSFLTFLSRVATVEDQSVSPQYMKVLLQANSKFGSKVKPLMLRLAQNDTELGFINMLTDLR